MQMARRHFKFSYRLRVALGKLLHQPHFPLPRLAGTPMRDLLGCCMTYLVFGKLLNPRHSYVTWNVLLLLLDQNHSTSELRRF